MANTTRQNSLLINQDWTKVYESFRNADFTSYDFQTLRKAMIDYLRLYYPEDFNDYVESSEYIALIDLIAYLGQNLAFRADLNARENFLDTAERRDSVLKLARLVSYNPKRNQTATGFLKFDSVQTTETLSDSNDIDLTNLIIKWNDSTNINWYEQFVTVLNNAFPRNQQVGRPANSKTIGGIKNDEYNINLVPGNVPVYKFEAQIENSALSFEVVSPTTANENYIYEVPPRPGNPLNILYRNDNQGNASNNTGFFFYFKQGELQTLNFTVAESIPNNVVAINFDNINNTDIWLYQLGNANTIDNQWSQIPAVSGVNIIYNNNAAKRSFQVSSRVNDQIDLVFGDGTFAAIPQGSFRTYFRTSTGLTYKITPDEMQNVQIQIPYVSRTGRLETLTVIASLKYTVANAIARETLAEIKTKAPQLYYTQNRMVTGEDYQTFPYANFNSISKVKSVNRTSSGVSRFLDVIDSTGRYSSTNIFADDGILYREVATSTLDFTWATLSDINRVVKNEITPLVQSKEVLHFYYEYFNRFSLTNLYWNRSTIGSGSCTGYFVDSTGEPQQIGANITGNNSYLNPGSIVIFSPGTGNYFDANNDIKPLPSSGNLPANGNLLLYITITNLVGNGSQGVLSNGNGPVAISDNLPSDAQAITVIPAFSNSFTTEFQSELITLISSYTEFGIRYDQETRSWAIVSAQNIDLTSDFNQTNEGDESGLNSDASWLLSFTVDGLIYNVESRGLSYLFESTSETKFYFDETVKIFDPVTGLTINDSVNILKVNGDPDTSEPLQQNILWYIYNQVAESDGYVDNSKVLVTYSDVNDDGVPDNPDIFTTVVQPDVNTNTKIVYFVKAYGYENFVTYEPVDNALINSSYATKFDILPVVNEFLAGQIFYTTTSEEFYVLEVSAAGTRTLVLSNDYLARTGRQSLYFQYKHNAPGNRRLDPSPSNLIDMYILSKEYENSYRTWALDTTGTQTEPTRPTSETLRLDYQMLEEYKSVSDAIIYNSAKFKPLFGNKARPELQATFKVIKNPNITLSDTEIRSQVLAYINAFFASDNWDFGETFYFTELATYIQQGMAPNITSIIIVPNSNNQVYGSLQQISSEPDEILISVATVQNIEVISAITAAQLNLQNQAVNTIIN
jgi:hypothetical protein